MTIRTSHSTGSWAAFWRWAVELNGWHRGRYGWLIVW